MNKITRELKADFFTAVPHKTKILFTFCILNTSINSSFFVQNYLEQASQSHSLALALENTSVIPCDKI